MKKISALFLAVIMTLSLFGCKAQNEKITLSDLDKLLSNQPVIITDTELLIQNGNLSDKKFYPDMLTATFRNCTEKQIDYVKLAFVAWDKNGAPVKIKSLGEEKGHEIKAVQYKQLTLGSGRYYGKGMGIELEPDHNIASFKVIVVSFKTNDGEKWDNPYFEVFEDTFVSKQYRKSTMIELKKQKDDFKRLSQNELAKTDMAEAEIKDELSKLPVEIISSEYIIRGEDKDSAPDVIKTLFKNNGDKEITNFTIGLFGYDENGKAVRLTEAGDYASQGNYLTLVHYSAQGFIKDTVFGENDLYQVNENCGVKYVVAIIKSYTDIDGKTFENPYFIDACLIYEGGKIEVEMPDTEQIEIETEQNNGDAD